MPSTMIINSLKDTIVAPATTPGTGAISVIRVSGPGTFAIADKVVRLRSGSISEAKGYTIHFGTVPLEDGRPLDDVLVSVFRAPHSYTGEDSVEISCHASSFVVSRLMQILCENGARMAEPGEYTRRAFVNGKMDLSQAEAVADVISSTSEASLRTAMNQMRGGYSAEFRALRQQLLKMTSLLELELDFSEEDVEFADREKLMKLVGKISARVESLRDSFRVGNAIKNGVPVAIAGSTNTGKSTLLNALLRDDRAIVSDIEGTTRDTVEEQTVIDGILFRFIDTAGIRETEETVEKMGIERSLRSISSASIVLCMADVSRPQSTVYEEIQSILSRTEPSRQEIIVLLNKADAIADGPGKSDLVDDVKSFVRSLGYDAPVLLVSAQSGAGLDLLRSILSAGQKDHLGSTPGETVVTNARHYEALSLAAMDLSRVASGLKAGTPPDLVAEDLRQAIWHIGTITGEITTDEVLGNIFSHFCIGK